MTALPEASTLEATQTVLAPYNGSHGTEESSSEPWHGTLDGYTNRGCRCEPCRANWRTYCRQREWQRRQEQGDPVANYTGPVWRCPYDNSWLVRNGELDAYCPDCGAALTSTIRLEPVPSPAWNTWAEDL